MRLPVVGCKFRLSKGRVLLFHAQNDPQSWKVRLALALKPLSFESRVLNISEGDIKTEVYRRLVPTEVYPALFIDGRILPGSQAALMYLEEQRPNLRSLLPTDHDSRAAMRLLCSNLDYALNTLSEGEPDTTWNQRNLDQIESILLHTAGLFSIGDRVTLADVSLFPRLLMGLQLGGKLDNHPHLSRVYRSLSQFTEFVESKPQTNSL
jgi:glutathione S-transferase